MLVILSLVSSEMLKIDNFVEMPNCFNNLVKYTHNLIKYVYVMIKMNSTPVLCDDTSYMEVGTL